MSVRMVTLCVLMHGLCSIARQIFTDVSGEILCTLRSTDKNAVMKGDN